MYHILLVGDNDMILARMEAYLKKKHYKIRSFLEQDRAIIYINENAATIDLLIIDFVDPEILGLDFIHKIRSRKITFFLPILVLSKYEYSYIDHIYRDYNISAYLEESYLKEIFLEKVSEILGRNTVLNTHEKELMRGSFRKGELYYLLELSEQASSSGALEVFSEDERFNGVLTLENGVVKEVCFIVDNERMPFSSERATEAINDIHRGYYFLKKEN